MICAFFSLRRWARYDKLFLLLKRIAKNAQYHGTSGTFTEIEGILILVSFCPTLWHVNVWTMSLKYLLFLSHSLSPIIMMLSILRNGIISCRRESQLKSLLTKELYRPGESAYSWGRTVNVYYWPYQLKAKLLLLNHMDLEKKAFSSWIEA